MRPFLCTLLLLLTTVASATPPRTLSYRGVLTDGSGDVVSDGSYATTFAIYASPSSGTALWTEAQDVGVANGNFDVVLGSINPLLGLSFDDPYWLGLRVGSDPADSTTPGPGRPAGRR